jgi:hypothetical protein
MKKITINIMKNGKSIIECRCKPSQTDRYFARAVNIAGGMWNGKDNFSVITKK